MAQTEKDYYLTNTPQKPKFEIGSYVASKGILVPQRYESLFDALSSGKPFIVRSEHPQDYNGASDIVDSFVVDQQKLDTSAQQQSVEVDWTEYFKRPVPDVKREVVASMVARLRLGDQSEFEANVTNLSFRKVQEHCHYSGSNEDIFRRELTYSYWEWVQGKNRTVVADSAVENRYHIFSSIRVPRPDDPESYRMRHGYAIVEDRRVTAKQDHLLPDESGNDFLSLIDFYESVRNLDKFDPNHCPIIEAQTVGNNHYFLQYHRTRDFYPATFTLDPSFEGMQPLFVRGVTPPDGLNVELRLNWRPATVDKDKPGGVDIHWAGNHIREVYFRNRVLQVVRVAYPDDLHNSDPSHLMRSQLFKPQVSMVMTRDDLNELRGDIGYSRENRNPSIQVHIVSDGRNARIQRI